MRARWFAVLCLALLPAATGCVYLHVTEPLDVNFARTPAAAQHEGGSVKRVSYAWADVQWSTNAIGDIARQNGITRVHYADVETLRILGVWTERWVHVYGE